MAHSVMFFLYFA